jgi:hypothetical protein
MVLLLIAMDFPQHTPVVRKGKIQSLGKENLKKNIP